MRPQHLVPHASQAGSVDVCLILEGTYPFVPGGVSSWVHHLVTHMPDLQFGILHISPAPDFHEGDLAYPVPDNVRFLQEVFLTRPGTGRSLPRTRVVRNAIEAFWNAIEGLRGAGDPADFRTCVESLQALGRQRLDVQDVMLVESSWEVMLDLYRDEAAHESFLDFFWSWLFAYEPLLNALTTQVPDAKLFHTVSTGYAGVLAAGAACVTGRPMILTEHGIYTKERRIEIHSAHWIKDWLPEEYQVENTAPYFQLFWNRHFEAMSRICYQWADGIYTLYADNVRAQLRDGADVERTRVIPNGVAVERLAEAHARWEAEGRVRDERFTVAFVGRVCPIKDVRTFLAAMRLVVRQVPDVLIRVLGPMEEDKEYAEGCIRFAEQLGLQDHVRFEGRISIADELPRVDVIVLTSISEAQPLVLLEAGALGIPSVATDVGSCRELLEGGAAADRGIGVGGFLTPIASPGETARAVLALYEDPDLREVFGKNMQTRVRRFYDQRDMVDAYEEIYERCIAGDLDGIASAADTAALEADEAAREAALADQMLEDLV